MYSKFIVNHKMLLSICLGVTCLVGDILTDRFANSLILKAFCDNLTHRLIGLFSALIIVSEIRYQVENPERALLIAACSFVSSLIDIDHFIAAGSWALKDATSLVKRPVLHCSTIPILLCLIFLVLLIKQKLLRINLWIVMLCCAFLTHHTRDATRRGFWIYPFGSTKAIPYVSYVLLTILIPHVFVYLLNMATKINYAQIKTTSYFV